MAPLCRFWVKGQCKFGNSCKFDHPPLESSRNDNRFAALQTPDARPSSSHAAPQSSAQAARAQRMQKYLLTREGIQADLSNESPQWILSAYGPGSRAPIQLFGGSDREQSFEEVRLRFYEARASGNPALEVRNEEELARQARAQMQNTLNDIDGAIDYVLNGENVHPNRIDVCQNPGLSIPSSNGVPSGAAGNGGMPSSMSQTFNQPPVSSSGTFGQPSVLGRPQNPFSTGGGGLSGTPNTTPSPFNQFSTPQNQSRFQNNAASANPLSTNQNQGQVNPFGQPITQATSNNLVSPMTGTSSGFSAPSLSQTTSNPLAVASNPNPNPFQAQPNPFNGIPSQQPQNPFGQKPTFNPFSNANSANSFPPKNDNVSNTAPQQTTMNGTSQNSATQNGTGQHPQLSSYASVDAQQRLVMFKNKPVVYKEGEAGVQNRDGSWEKIWFPEGQPNYYKDTEVEDDKYDEAAKTAYARARESGRFENGIPLLPPKREWCRWDF